MKSLIHEGDTLYNPLTKERLETSAETGGEHTFIERRAAPRAAATAAHVHAAQTETFELEGRFAAKVDGNLIEAGPGDVVAVDRGQAHRWWNPGADELVFRTEIQPALRFEPLIDTTFSLAADGKTNRRGLPNPLRLSVIAGDHLDDVVLPFSGRPAEAQSDACRATRPAPRYLPTYERPSTRPADAR